MSDDFFGDEAFDSIVRDFFGGMPRNNIRKTRKIVTNEDEDRSIEVIETKDKFFLIFELPGFSEEDLDLKIENNVIKIQAQKSNSEEVVDYLSQKLARGVSIKKTLPEYTNSRKFNQTFKNGILEVSFEKR